MSNELSRAFARKPFLIAWGCVMALGLVACTALSYVEPTDDQTAELDFSTKAPLIAMFYRDAARCTDALQTRGAPVGFTSYKIPANRDFAFYFAYVSGGNPFGGSWEACGENILSFHPEKGKRYQLNFWWEQNRCVWALTENLGQDMAKVKFNKRERDPSITSMAGEGTWCKALPS